jgi:hypothetical protein
VPLAEALPPLRQLLAAESGAPKAERARAALYLAAIELRSGDRAGAAAALDAAGLDPAARTWADRAATVLAAERRPYRAVLDAPPALQSPSDDDPAELPPVPPAPPPPPARPEVATRAKAPVRAAAKATAKAKPTSKGGAKPGAKPAAKPATKAPAKKAAAPAKKPAARPPAR